MGCIPLRTRFRDVFVSCSLIKESYVSAMKMRIFRPCESCLWMFSREVEPDIFRPLFIPGLLRMLAKARRGARMNPGPMTCHRRCRPVNSLYFFLSILPISMRRLLALGALGIRTVRIPLSNSAWIDSTWTDWGTVNVRLKIP